MSAYDNSVDKELHLYFMEQILDDPLGPEYILYDHIQNDRVISESLSLTIGILEGQQFRLGSYVIPEMQVQVVYNDKRYRDKFVRVWVNDKPTSAIDNPTKHGLIFGRVYRETLSKDRTILTLTIRNVLYQAFNTEVDYNDTFFKDILGESTYSQITIRDFYSHLLKYTYAYALSLYNSRIIDTIDIDDNLDEIDMMFPVAEDNLIFRLQENKTFTLAQIWHYFGEYLGVHFKISNPNYSNYNPTSAYVTIGNDINIGLIRTDYIMPLYPNEDVYPGNVPARLPGVRYEVKNNTTSLPYYISFEYDEALPTSYNALDWSEQFNYREQNPTVTDDGIYFDSTSVYYFEGDNPLYYGYTVSNLQYVIAVTGLDVYMFGQKYIYGIIDAPYDYLEAGDNILIDTSGGDTETVGIPILSCQINGINSMIATYKANATTETEV